MRTDVVNTEDLEFKGTIFMTYNGQEAKCVTGIIFQYSEEPGLKSRLLR